MRSLILTLILALSLISIAQAQRSKPSASAAPEVLNVAYCELLRDPAAYNGKIVRVRATYRYGFEWSQFYCTDCSEGRTTWVDFDESYDLRTMPRVKRRLGSNG